MAACIPDTLLIDLGTRNHGWENDVVQAGGVGRRRCGKDCPDHPGIYDLADPKIQITNTNPCFFR
jgi:hypothetical protein